MAATRRSTRAGLALLAALVTAVPAIATAEVIAFERLAEEPYGTFAGRAYVRITGRVKGVLGTSEPIPGLAAADADGDGAVDYATDLVLVVPADPGASNGTLVVDLPNRGRPVAHTLYNSPGAVPVQGIEPGNGFLQRQGFMLAIPAWELGHGVELPTVDGADGEPRPAVGVGFAVVRDVAAWLRGMNGAAPDPLDGAVARTLVVGYSQTARFLKSFLLHGFNALAGRRVLDAMHMQAPHAGLLPLLRAGAEPRSAASAFPTFTAPDLRGVHEPPFTYAEIMAAAARFGAPLPRVVVTNMATDYYSLRASLARTGAAGTEDAPLPDNLRMYDVAGGAHALLPDAPDCDLPRGTLDWHPVMRALLVRLNAWARDGMAPPASRLMPLVPAAGQVLPVLGPPSSAPEAVIRVPDANADGNHQGGVRVPDIAVPLGTHRGQNGPLDDVLCTLSGAYVPFAPTRAERRRTGDPRRSLEERYGDRAAYVQRAARAAESLTAQGFMLAEDAAAAINRARRAPAFR